MLGERPHAVDEHQVNVRRAELLSRALDRRQRPRPRARPALGVHLGCDPDLVARHTAPLDGLREVAVVAIHLGRVDQSAALLQVLLGAGDQRRALGGWAAAGAKAHRRHRLRGVAVEHVAGWLQRRVVAAGRGDEKWQERVAEAHASRMAGGVSRMAGALPTSLRLRRRPQLTVHSSPLTAGGVNTLRCKNTDARPAANAFIEIH
eukprot:6729762-Prymnesium_polylepis.1